VQIFISAWGNNNLHGLGRQKIDLAGQARGNPHIQDLIANDSNEAQ
jgi:hypothetical protein